MGNSVTASDGLQIHIWISHKKFAASAATVISKITVKAELLIMDIKLI